jgi:ferredoxin
MRAGVDQPACTGAGYCEEVAGSVFAVLDSGLATVCDASGEPLPEGGGPEGVEVAADDESAVQDAAAMCPGGCIRILEVPH